MAGVHRKCGADGQRWASRHVGSYFERHAIITPLLQVRYAIAHFSAHARHAHYQQQRYTRCRCRARACRMRDGLYFLSFSAHCRALREARLASPADGARFAHDISASGAGVGNASSGPKVDDMGDKPASAATYWPAMNYGQEAHDAREGDVVYGRRSRQPAHIAAYFAIRIMLDEILVTGHDLFCFTILSIYHACWLYATDDTLR